MVDEPTLVDASLFPRLVVTAGGQISREIRLRKELSIGRAEDNDLQLPDPKVSRHHARIHREGANFILTDLGSANGTLIDGVRLSAPHALKQGERFTIGSADLTYLEPGQAFEDTITVPLAAPGARGAVQEQPTRAVPSPPPVPLPGTASQGASPRAPSGASRGVIVGLILVAAVVVLALVGVVLALLVPDFPAKIGLGSPATATQPPVVVAPTAPPVMGTPVESATATNEAATPTIPGVDDREMNDRLSQADALTWRSKFEDAIVIYEDLVNRAPRDARPEVGWAWVLIYDDQPEQALVHAQRAAELDPGSAAVQTVLARAYLANEDKDAALPVAQKAVEIEPGSAEAHAALAEAYLLDGQDQAATDEADLALVQDINSANAHRIRGWIYELVDHDMGRAAGELQIAAGLQPELWLRRHELGLLLLDAENYNTAIIAFQDALGLRPKAVTYTAIGEAYYGLTQYDQASASLQQAIAVGADNADTYALLAASYARLGRCDDAQQYIDQALVLDSIQPLALEAQDLCQNPPPVLEPSATSSSGGVVAATKTPAPPATSRPPSPQASVGGRIAFPVWNAQRGKYDTFVAQARDGSGRSLVVEEMHQPAFSPDGTWLAVNGERPEHLNLFIVKPDGSGLKEISQHIEDNLPCWSPDGRSLVFGSTMHGDKQPRVYIIDQVPFEGRRQEGRPLNFGPDDVRGEYPAWTADGQIVYQGCDYTVEPARCGLFVMSAAPGVHPFRRLTDRQEDTAPAAHGNRIAFMSNRDGNWELYIVNEDGSGLKRLTDNAANDGLPTWSPDGRTLAFVSNQGGAWAIWAMSPDGSNRRKLFDIGGGGLVFDWEHERISWIP
jgi:tetratricopeptide (TPR) repeat protein